MSAHLAIPLASALTYFQAVVLGFLQGVTELFPTLFGWNSLVKAQSESESFWLAFVVMLHVGSALGLLFYYRRDWVQIDPGNRHPEGIGSGRRSEVQLGRRIRQLPTFARWGAPFLPWVLARQHPARLAALQCLERSTGLPGPIAGSDERFQEMDLGVFLGQRVPVAQAEAGRADVASRPPPVSYPATKRRRQARFPRFPLECKHPAFWKHLHPRFG